jgi:ketosteroid isomerase-like protein
MTLSVRITILAILAVPVAASAQPPQPPRALSEKDVAELRSIADQDASLVRARNWAALVSQYADDAVRMPPNGPTVQGRLAIRAMLEGMPPISAFEFRMVDLKGDGDIAYMRAAWSCFGNSLAVIGYALQTRGTPTFHPSSSSERPRA